VKAEHFPDGIAIQGDSTSPEVWNYILLHLGQDFLFDLIIADPPYGNIVKESWDKVKGTDVEFALWMATWTRLWASRLVDRGAFYVWGGIGKPGFRPFLRYLPMVETKAFQLASLITWSKKRAYGVQNNYLFTREELAYFTKGDAKKPGCFNVPYLTAIRGYAGYNKKYPAKDARYRRTNVWTDINEIFKGKRHPTQKPCRTSEVIIEIHTKPMGWVLDPFAGAGTTALAARKLGRRFVVIEQDETYYADIVAQLKSELDVTAK
jgi:site-specific DNA-methyltransferase (adenine-specific)